MPTDHHSEPARVQAAASPRSTPRGSSSGLHGQVVDDVGQQIINGTLAPGTTILADQLCARLGISRSVVREGLRTLSSMGLVQSRPQRGTIVLSQDQWDLLNPHIIRWRGQGPDHMDQMNQLLELRLGLEPAAAHFAAVRMTAVERSAIVDAAEQMQKAYDADDTYGFFHADARLHRLLLEGSYNPVIAQFAGMVNALLQLRGGFSARRYSIHGIAEASVDRHLRMAASLAAGDQAAAEAITREIILATIAEVDSLRQAER